MCYKNLVFIVNYTVNFKRTKVWHKFGIHIKLTPFHKSFVHLQYMIFNLINGASIVFNIYCAIIEAVVFIALTLFIFDSIFSLMLCWILFVQPQGSILSGKMEACILILLHIMDITMWQKWKSCAWEKIELVLRLCSTASQIYVETVVVRKHVDMNT